MPEKDDVVCDLFEQTIVGKVERDETGRMLCEGKLERVVADSIWVGIVLDKDCRSAVSSA